MKFFFLMAILPSLVFGNAFFVENELVNSRGKKIELKEGPVLVVNIATQCGYTSQLDGLSKLAKKYEKQGLTVIGLPSNDFWGQTPESDEAVEEFCKVNYGATFPIMKKAVVSGDKKIALVDRLTKKAHEPGEIKWNFEKFLISKDGQSIKRFRSGVDPEGKEMTQAIEQMLEAK
jgi:glutathione peroxidase